VPLTYLFAPAHESRKVAHALASDSDAVILDLEDSVPDHQKDAARRLVREWVETLRQPSEKEVWVRVNAGGSALEADIAAIDWSNVTGAVIPKSERPEPLEKLREAGARRLLPLIESIAGLDGLERLVGAGGIERLAIGTWDLMLDLGVLAVADPDESELIWRLRGDLAIASRRLGLLPPVDGIYARIEDEAGLRSACERALRFGYAGKLLIHPRQIGVARSVFAVREEDLVWAREVIAAFQRANVEGLGAIRLRGQMYDAPMLERARAILKGKAGR
jgi:citrate lyase beta subunit